jgi:hypothetical protein
MLRILIVAVFVQIPGVALADAPAALSSCVAEQEVMTRLGRGSWDVG